MQLRASARGRGATRTSGPTPRRAQVVGSWLARASSCAVGEAARRRTRRRRRRACGRLGLEELVAWSLARVVGARWRSTRTSTCWRSARRQQGQGGQGRVGRGQRRPPAARAKCSSHARDGGRRRRGRCCSSSAPSKPLGRLGEQVERQVELGGARCPASSGRQRSSPGRPSVGRRACSGGRRSPGRGASGSGRAAGCSSSTSCSKGTSWWA